MAEGDPVGRLVQNRLIEGRFVAGVILTRGKHLEGHGHAGTGRHRFDLMKQKRVEGGPARSPIPAVASAHVVHDESPAVARVAPATESHQKRADEAAFGRVAVRRKPIARAVNVDLVWLDPDPCGLEMLGPRPFYPRRQVGCHREAAGGQLPSRAYEWINAGLYCRQVTEGSRRCGVVDTPEQLDRNAVDQRLFRGSFHQERDLAGSTFGRQRPVAHERRHLGRSELFEVFTDGRLEAAIQRRRHLVILHKLGGAAWRVPPENTSICADRSEHRRCPGNRIPKH